MHEMSLAEGILQIIEDAAVRQGFSRVKEIRLEIGALSGVEVDALNFSLETVLRQSVADGARIELEILPGEGFCLDCGQSVPIQALYDSCPLCGGYRVQATAGMEMRVKDLLVE